MKDSLGVAMSWAALARLAPDVLPWLARVFEVREANPEVVGGGFLVDDRHVLTCAHVVLVALGRGEKDPLPAGEVRVRLDFPAHAGEAGWATVVCDGWVPVDEDGRGDVAVLELAEPLPAGAEPAPLQAATGLRDHTFSTHGFPSGEPWGVDAVGVLRGREGPSWQWVRIEDTKQVGRAVERGFSGAPVWDDQCGAVVGMVVAQDRRLEAKGAYAIPVAVLAEAWPPLASLAAPGLDVEELRTHWAPRSRGVERLTPTTGWYFTGRRQALRELVGWLTAPPGQDPRGRVVTGGPGSGKSAVLARLVTLSDPRYRLQVPLVGVEEDTVPPLGSVTVAVHTRGKTLDEVVAAVATAVDVPARDPDALVAALLARGRPLVLVVDALDEATGGGTDLVRRLLRPLAADGGSLGIRVLVGTRRPLLDTLGTAAFDVIDLDEEPYLAVEDLADYVARRLLLEDEPTLRTPYRNRPELARRVAAAVAARAYPTFLVAQLVSRALTQDAEPVEVDRSGWRDRFPATVAEAMDDDLYRFGADEYRARDLLRPLAYAEGDGLPHTELWVNLANALADRTRYTLDDVTWLQETTAAAYLIETRHPDRDAADDPVVYRLFHQALVEYLRPEKDERAQQQLFTQVLLATVTGTDERRDWRVAPRYVTTHLATHAAAAGRLDKLLADPGYLVVADPDRLLPVLRQVLSTGSAEAITVYLRCADRLRGTTPPARASVLELTARLVDATWLADQLAAVAPDRPWSTAWARSALVSRHVIARGHTDWVDAVAVGSLADGTPVVVSGGRDGTVRIWDLDTGAARGSLTGHQGWVRAVAVGSLADGTSVIVSGGGDGTVRIWDLDTGAARGSLTGHTGAVRAVAVGSFADGTPVVVSGGSDGTVRIWDLDTGAPRGSLTGHTGPVTAVAVGRRPDTTPVVVSGGDDGTVRIWDLDTGAPRGSLTGHQGRVRAVAVGSLADGTPVVVSGGSDDGVRIWDLHTGAPRGQPLIGHQGRVRAVAVGSLAGPVVVSGGSYGTVRIWDLHTGAPRGSLTGHQGWVTAVAVGRRPDTTPVVVSGGSDGTVRIWDLDTGAPRGSLTGHTGAVRAVAVGSLAGPVVVSGGDDGTVQIWDLDTGAFWGQPLTGHEGWVTAVAVGSLADGTPVIVSGGSDGTVRIWDLDTGAARGHSLTGHTDWVTAVAVGTLADGTPMIVSGGGDGTVRIWDLDTGAPRGSLTGHTGAVRAVAVGSLADGTSLIVSGSDDGMRIWDLDTGAPRGSLTGHTGAVRAVAVGSLADGTSLIVSGSSDRTVRVWDLAGRAPRGQPLTGHKRWVGAVAVGSLADGTPVILSGGDDGTVRIWDLDTGAPYPGLFALDWPVYCLASVGIHIAIVTGQGIIVAAPTQASPIRSHHARPPTPASCHASDIRRR